MMKLLDISDYTSAISHPKDCFLDKELQAGQSAIELMGQPQPITGRFAGVFKIKSNGKLYAVKCFLILPTDQAERYEAIHNHLRRVKLSYFREFDFQQSGITVNGSPYPIVKMDWLSGDTLGTWFDNHLAESSQLQNCAGQFLTMIRALRRHDIAHGDLQHGNIMVVNNELRLIDFDGMFVPALVGRSAAEVGMSQYQHPSREKAHFGPYLDNVSGWVIYLALLGQSADPDLRRRLFGPNNRQLECLIFQKEDLQHPGDSNAFAELKKSSHRDVRHLAAEFCRLLASKQPIETFPSIDEILRGERAKYWWIEQLPYAPPRSAPVPRPIPIAPEPSPTAPDPVKPRGPDRTERSSPPRNRYPIPWRGPPPVAPTPVARFITWFQNLTPQRNRFAFAALLTLSGLLGCFAALMFRPSDPVDIVVTVEASPTALQPATAVTAIVVAPTPSAPPVPPSPTAIPVYVPPLLAMVSIGGGTFAMGSPETEAQRQFDEGPQHLVTIEPFLMSATEVTQAEYAEVMGVNPSTLFNCDDCPVETVSWEDAVDFCNRLSVREKLTPCYSERDGITSCNWKANGYRLPTEAEWEYACRAKTTSPFHHGDTLGDGQAQFNSAHPYGAGAKVGSGSSGPVPVKTYKANAWGLFGMHGNVWEWCWDYYDDRYPSADHISAPAGPDTGAERILRGGSWAANGQSCRSANREKKWQGFGERDWGFRVVRRQP